MTGALARIGGAVSFIFDPVPRVDRTSKSVEELYGLDLDPLDSIDWSKLVEIHERPLTPPPPYNWATQHAFPVDGWGPP